MWSGKKVLVTGAGGFIGSHLTEALVVAGATTTAMVRYNSGSLIGNLAFIDRDARDALRIVSGNIEDSDFVYQAIKGQDIVLHLAALIAIPYSYEAPRSYVRTNIEGTLNVLEARSALRRLARGPHQHVGGLWHGDSACRSTRAIRCRGNRRIRLQRSPPTSSPRAITVRSPRRS